MKALVVGSLFVWLTLPLAADALSITTVTRGEPPVHPVHVRLQAVPLDGSSPRIERSISVPGTEAIDVASGNWQVSIDSPDYWAAAVIAQADRPAVVELWPTGTLSGEAKVSRRGDEVEELRVAFAPAMENPAIGAPSGEGTCSVDAEHWRCKVPAGTWDLRFLSKGFATEFRWNQTIRARKNAALGTLYFRPGASLHGFIGTARGVNTVNGAVIVAQPRSVAGDGSPRRYTAVANHRGFFQIAGLSPGEYLIHAEAKQYRSEDRPVTILADLNAELRSPLILEKPRMLVVTVDSPENRIWHIRLYRRLGDGHAEQAVATVMSAAGRWTGELVPGQYILHVGPGGDAVWASTEVVLDAADAQIELSIPTVRVTGTVTIGKRPLAKARLLFGGNQGLRRQTLVTDSDGAFSGELPTHETSGTSWKISIEAEAPHVRRTGEFTGRRDDDGELHIDVELPATVVKGRVIHEDETAERGAIVTLRSPDGSVFEQAFTEANGSFELVGFDPGRYRIQAEAFQLSSDILDIEATAGEALPIEIVLRSDVVVRGRIRARNTAGVEASLTGLQRGVRTNFIPAAMSDPEGFFVLRLPPRTRVFDLVIQSPGFAMAAGRVEIRDDKFLNITMDQLGGSLVLEIPSRGDAVLLHDGGEYPARWLADLSGASVETTGEWQIARLFNVEPGMYSLCANGRCNSGIVTPAGSLMLSVRSGG